MSPVTSARAAKKELILTKAYELFCEKGYTDTKIIEIAEAAGIGKGTVYEYFGSKEDIFFDIFDRYVTQHYYKNLQPLLESAGDTKEKILRYVHFEMEFMSAVGNGKNHLSRFMSDHTLFQDGRLCEAIGQFMKFRTKTLHDILAEGIRSGEFIQMDPELATAAIAGAINTFLTRNYNLIGPGAQGGLKQPWSAEDLMPILLNGLTAKKETA
ncbi:MAG: TetR/AcrR family transcriptional regulator [Firmicutes bacterium]|nr:TetR/AcrR family transcriptional regulator [Bacillota bacterium]